MDMDLKADFYVYMLYRDVELAKPFYVGKGRGRRLSSSKKKIGRNAIKNAIIEKCIKLHGFVPGSKISENLTEEQAFALEKHFIAVYGRIDLKTGTLANMTEGGDGPSGWVMSNTQKEIMRQHGLRRSKTLEWQTGMRRKNIKASDETREKMREAHAKRSKRPPSQALRDAANAWCRDPENKAKLAKRNKERIWRLDSLEKMRKAHTGLKKHTPESRAKLSAAHRGRRLTIEQKEKIRKKALERWQRWRDAR